MTESEMDDFPPYNKPDLKSFLIHKALFSGNEDQPALKAKARAIASRWIAMHGEDFSPYWGSWIQKIDTLSWSELREFALGNSDQSIAHRQSSPFSCCLGHDEKIRIRRYLRNES